MNNFSDSGDINVWHDEPDDNRSVDNVCLILQAIIDKEGRDLIIQNCYEGGIRAQDASEVLEYIYYQEGISQELIKALEYAKCNVRFI